MLENIAFYITLLSFFTMAISFFIFSRIIVKRIDREMAKDGLPKSDPVDIAGLRVFSISITVITPMRFLPEQDIFFTIGARATHRYAKRGDRIVAATIWVSLVCMLLAGSQFK